MLDLEGRFYRVRPEFPDKRKWRWGLALHAETIPISNACQEISEVGVKHLSVFKLDAVPKSSPIDLNVAAMCEEPEGDAILAYSNTPSFRSRVRYWRSWSCGRSFSIVKISL